MSVNGYFDGIGAFSTCLEAELTAVATQISIPADAVSTLCGLGCAPFEMELNYRDCIKETLLVTCDNNEITIVRGKCPERFPAGTKLNFVWTEHNILLAQEANMPGFISGKTTTLLGADTVQLSTDQPDIVTNINAGCRYVLKLYSGSVVEKVVAHSTVMSDIIIVRGAEGTTAREWPAGTCFTTHLIEKDTSSEPCPKTEDKIKAKEICVPVFNTKGFALDFGDGTLSDTIAAIFCALAMVRDGAGISKSEVNQCIADALANLPPSGVSKSEVITCIEDAIAQLDFYTRQQVNDLIANLQDQVTSLVARVTALEVCVDELKNAPVFVVPTGSWGDVLDGSCPAISSSVVTNPEGVNLCAVATGTADVEVKVGGTIVANILDFIAADGDTVEISVSHPTDNIVGGISVFYIDPDDASNKILIDGFQYDAQCASTTGPDAPDITCPTPGTFAVGATVDLTVTNVGGAVDTWEISPALPASLTFSGGVISGTIDSATDQVFTITAENAGGTDDCTISIVTAAPQLSISCTRQTVVHDSSAGAATYGSFNVNILNGSGNYTITQVGVFIAGVTFQDNGDGSYNWNMSSGVSPGGPENYILTVTDNVTGQSDTCAGGTVEVTGIIP